MENEDVQHEISSWDKAGKPWALGNDYVSASPRTASEIYTCTTGA
jgi:hypothetical protein